MKLTNNNRHCQILEGKTGNKISKTIFSPWLYYLQQLPKKGRAKKPSAN